MEHRIGGRLGDEAGRIGEYTYDKEKNGASAFTNGKYVIFYGGDRNGWQWVPGYNHWAGYGPKLSNISTAREFVEYEQFSTGRGMHVVLVFAGVKICSIYIISMKHIIY